MKRPESYHATLLVPKVSSSSAPDFDSRNYGYAKLGELVEATKLFDMEERPAPNSNAKHKYVRDKRKK